MLAPSRLVGPRGCRSSGALLSTLPSSSPRRRRRGANQNPCSAVSKDTLHRGNLQIVILDARITQSGNLEVILGNFLTKIIGLRVVSCLGCSLQPALSVSAQKLQISEKKLPGDPMKRISFLGDLFFTAHLFCLTQQRVIWGCVQKMSLAD